WTLSNRSVSMEHLVMGLVLVASTLAAGNPLILRDLELINVIRMDMVPTSFDDQYRGCSPKMEQELGKLNHTEFTSNSIYADYWKKAALEWQKKGNHAQKPPALRREHAVAIMAFSLPGRLYKSFNAAVRQAGLSRSVYLDKFPFKVLHFLLTQAVSILRDSQPHRCYTVYRGVRGTRFTARHQDVVRFGQFTSSSLKMEVAAKFGRDTFFSVYTCYGVPIWNYSYYPTEYEVLIPPYETFKVTNIKFDGKGTLIELRSMGTFSRYNCAWLQGD
ncbi:NARE ribosyltransferase, partial [Rostratula benghalensis]|nr:NARE ribosyltransferase [Rostratula benghalensis]